MTRFFDCLRASLWVVQTATPCSVDVSLVTSTICLCDQLNSIRRKSTANLCRMSFLEKPQICNLQKIRSSSAKQGATINCKANRVALLGVIVTCSHCQNVGIVYFISATDRSLVIGISSTMSVIVLVMFACWLYGMHRCQLSFEALQTPYWKWKV